MNPLSCYCNRERKFAFMKNPLNLFPDGWCIETIYIKLFSCAFCLNRIYVFDFISIVIIIHFKNYRNRIVWITYICMYRDYLQIKKIFVEEKLYYTAEHLLINTKSHHYQTLSNFRAPLYNYNPSKCAIHIHFSITFTIYFYSIVYYQIWKFIRIYT